jgi:thiazole tautomerase (transcriptional regulator TenI)
VVFFVWTLEAAFIMFAGVRELAGKELHVVSTGRQPFAELARIAGLVGPYVDAFHLRERTKTARELLDGIRLLTEAGVPAGRIVVNDRADVAAAAGVRGVQLAHHSLDVPAVKRLFPELRIGKSVHSVEEALQAEAEGADYVIYGHIYATASKPGLPARGVVALRRVADSVRIPVIAIGGIKPGSVPEVLRAGAAGVAVMSGLLEAADPVREAAAYHQYLQVGREGHEH